MNPWLKITWFTNLPNDLVMEHHERVKLSAVGHLIAEIVERAGEHLEEIRIEEWNGETPSGRLV